MNQNNGTLDNAFFDIIYILAKRRNFLVSFVVVGVLIAFSIALFTTKYYKATTSVLAAEQSDLLSSLTGLSSLAKNFSPLKGLGSLSSSSETDKFSAILKSSSVKRDLIQKFNLRKVYDMEKAPYYKVEKELSGNLEFSTTDEGTFQIEVYDESPERAALMANYLVNKLNDLNSELHSKNAKSTREFIEKRYFQNVNDIASYENKMKEFQIKNGVIAVPQQVDATIKAMTNLYADLAKEEIAYNVLQKKNFDAENPILQGKAIEISELKKKINQLNSEELGSKEQKALIPLNKSPELLGDYLKIYRNLEIQYKILEYITPIYEQSKIEEARNTPSVLVLDKAYPPEKKAKPKIALYILIGFVASLIIGLFTTFMLELFTKLSKIDPIKMNYIKSSFNPFKRVAVKS